MQAVSERHPTCRCSLKNNGLPPKNACARRWASAWSVPILALTGDPGLSALRRWHRSKPKFLASRCMPLARCGTDRSDDARRSSRRIRARWPGSRHRPARARRACQTAGHAKVRPWSIQAKDLPLEHEINAIQAEYGYGEVWGRPALGYRIRSFITLATLQALVENDQLHFHINNALNLGITPEEVYEGLLQAGGLPDQVPIRLAWPTMRHRRGSPHR